MNLSSSNATSNLISRLRDVINPDSGALLVGGVVRDQLTGTPCHDIDLILPGDTRQAARRAADLLGGKFFPLDETRGIYRILLSSDDGQFDFVDISRLQAVSVEDDLRLRDFTINAIAVKLHKPDSYYDPLNGRNDLKEHILRTCSDFSLENDPVRVIRAARMSLTYNLRFAPGLLSKIRAVGPNLRNTSAERQRDEIFKIFEGKNPASGIRLLDSFNVLSLLFPEVTDLKGVQQSLPHTMDAFEHTLALLDQLQWLLDLFLLPEKVLADGGNLMLGLAAGKLGIFREGIKNHYRICLNPFRTRKSMNLLGALLHDVGKSQTKSVGEDGRFHFYKHEILGADIVREKARSMALSEVEVDALSRMVEFHMHPRIFAKDDRLPTRRSIYRFFRQTRDYGVDVCFLSLADYLAKTVYPPQQEVWGLELDRIAVYLEGWFTRKAVWVEPEPLVNGEDIMSFFNIPSGRIIGEVLAAIQEANAAGEISTREEALEFAKVIVYNPARELDE